MNIVKLSDSEFETLVDFVYKRFGINLQKKRVLIEGRMASTLREKKLDSFSDYIDLLFSDNTGSETNRFINKITTNHSFFMREMEHFRYMAEVALPYFKKNRKSKELRIWSAGCATGEEPYTISMTLSDFFDMRKEIWKTSILASDISMNALGTAKTGIYPEASVKNVPQAWKNTYFVNQRDGSYKIADKIRRPIQFKPINLNEDFYFSKPFDIIFCRNVMIYFDNAIREKLINRFYQVCADDGYLFVGHSEVVNKRATKFQYVMPAVYRKKEE